MDPDEFRNTLLLHVHQSARKHGVAEADIRHALRNVMATETQTRGRVLWVGPARSSVLLEVVTVRTEAELDVAIHAMRLRTKYERLLPGRG